MGHQDRLAYRYETAVASVSLLPTDEPDATHRLFLHRGCPDHLGRRGRPAMGDPW